MYLLDTSTLIHLLDDNPAVIGRLAQMPPAEPIYASVIAEGELLAGAYRLPPVQQERELRAVRGLLRGLTILPVTSELADRYGRIRAYLGPRSRNDAWIAATALEHDLILVADDQHFSRVPDLVVENWVG